MAGKICKALQAIPGLLVTDGRIWLVEDEVADWDEVEACGLRRSQINAALLSAALSAELCQEDEVADLACDRFAGRTVHEP